MALWAPVIRDKMDDRSDTEALQRMTGIIGGFDLHGCLGEHPRCPRGQAVLVSLVGLSVIALCMKRPQSAKKRDRAWYRLEK